MGQSVWGVVLACGKSEQLVNQADTAFLSVGNKPVLAYSLQAFEQCPEIESILVVISKDRVDMVKGLVHLFGCSKLRKIVIGSSRRDTSLNNALKAIDGEASVVVIQEASRPNISPKLVTSTIKAAQRYGTGLAAAHLSGDIRETVKGQKSRKRMDGSNLWEVQTPRAYKWEVLKKALAAAARKKVSLNDESAAFELIRGEVHLVPSSRLNIKLSEPDDLAVISVLLS